ncbi:crossover junction endodeoxyribonuclease RuvC [Candidatus Roizmanbacteria bacterium RIFCSPLOWO2_01_FULL_38_11]|uniref:Crossover junction endodeoxyribonuclease RuvC n=1 Tax=Candidatus Roizmanbacteria bacterium RIFCSPLOWO2_01_FULL_38_11 TaxID=1802060 RepID=A0A1F7ILK7_9BACT|nr:MAG: crossover junction endodeoxyribonuclease RuvC [Candidatus Roizmanbacteria bacterium RIFCSPLOWO2_01_FULL_38_11]
MRILAFDSGIERTGYAFFSIDERKYYLENYGCIITKKTDTLQVRIQSLYEDVKQLINKTPVDYFVFEQLFFNINKKTAISVAQAQGALLSLAGKHSLNVYFISPPQIKQTVTGNGNADKKSVQKMVMMLLNIKEAPKLDDTADAIACGLTFCVLSNSSKG